MLANPGFSIVINQISDGVYVPTPGSSGMGIAVHPIKILASQWLKIKGIDALDELVCPLE